MNKKELKKAYAYIKSEIDEMDDLDFMALNSFYELIRGQIVSVLKLGDEITFNFRSIDDNSTASTNGNQITLNTWSPLVVNCKNRYEKYLSNIGSGSHECGHILYTNFDLINSIVQKIRSEKYKFKYSRRLKKQNENFRFCFKELMEDLINIVEDGYIENCLKLEYPAEGILVKGLQVGNQAKYDLSFSLEQYEEAINKGEEILADAFVWCLQIQNCLGFELKGIEQVSGDIQNKIVEYVNNAKPLTDRYINKEESHEEVIGKLAEMVYELLLETPFKDNENEDSQSEESNENNDESQNQDSTESKDEGKEGNPNKKVTAKLPKGVGASKRKPQESNENDNSNKGSIVDQTKNLNEEIVKNTLEELLEDNSKKEFARFNSLISSEVMYRTPKMDKEKYDIYYKEIEKISKAAQKKIKNILAMRDFDESTNGYYMGSKFEPSLFYRNNGRYFSRQNIPSSRPDVVFEIIIDSSGSMEDYGKIEAAKNAAILFEDISRNLDIPTHIIAHTTDTFRIVINDIIPFYSKEENKYRLASLKPEWGNIDTEVLTLVCEEISRRNETNKVVIVISDGLPCSYENHNDYRGVAFKNDKTMDDESLELNACVRYWRKKGINIIGVAIDETECIKKIYEDGMLDCTNINRLPSKLLKVFQKYVLKE